MKQDTLDAIFEKTDQLDNDGLLQFMAYVEYLIATPQPLTAEEWEAQIWAKRQIA